MEIFNLDTADPLAKTLYSKKAESPMIPAFAKFFVFAVLIVGNCALNVGDKDAHKKTGGMIPRPALSLTH